MAKQLYFKINFLDNAIIRPVNHDDSIGFNSKADSIANGKNYLVPVTIIKPAYNPETEVRDGPFDDYDGVSQSGTRTFTVRPKTQAELDSDEKQTEDQLDVQTISSDVGIRTLLKARPTQIDSWIDNNVTDLASAREVLKKMAKVMSILARNLLQ